MGKNCREHTQAVTWPLAVIVIPGGTSGATFVGTTRIAAASETAASKSATAESTAPESTASKSAAAQSSAAEASISKSSAAETSAKLSLPDSCRWNVLGIDLVLQARGQHREKEERLHLCVWRITY